MQRFGTRSVPTHVVGKLMVKKDWAGAVRTIIGQYDPNKAGDKDARA